MGNTFGTLFRVTTWGESHGPALGAVIDGCPAALPLSEDDIRRDLARDIPDPALGTQRAEENRFQILSGVFEGRTLGTPISIVVWNNDARSKSYDPWREMPRPGHADLTWRARYGHVDWRGGGRASGRECIARLAAGAVARALLGQAGVVVDSRLTELAGVKIDGPETLAAARARALEIAGEGDSSGGLVEVDIAGVPPGIGSPVFDKLSAALAQAVMTIGGVRAVEIGEGQAAARGRGRSENDPIAMALDGRPMPVSNRCGGLLGGISTGGDIVLRLAVKPTPSLHLPQATVDLARGEACTIEMQGRFDRNFAPRVGPIAEAMCACVVADHLLQSGVLPPCRLSIEPE